MFGADFPLFTYERLEGDWADLGLSSEVLRDVQLLNAANFLADGRAFEAQATMQALVNGAE
jgi:predicted TIM-barrel fold metal-dependent hydrolase